MKITMSGRAYNLTNKETKYILSFFGNILLGKRLASNIEINFQYRMLNGNDSGTTIPADYYERNSHHRYFYMDVDPYHGRDELIRIIGHEMEHVRQFARGELVNPHRNYFNWLGTHYVLTDDTYPYLPWEKQAQLSEPWLLHFYDQHMAYAS
jgi:hypothetical protein